LLDSLLQEIAFSAREEKVTYNILNI